jgi:photosystem II stability/assembly factor-like uncharacterized protein
MLELLMKRLILIVVGVFSLVVGYTTFRFYMPESALSRLKPTQPNEQISPPSGKWHVIANKIEQPFGQIQFIDEFQGWGVSTNSLWRTQDGGRTWNRVSAVPTMPTKGILQGTDVYYKVQFLNDRNGWLLRGSSLLHTDDTGRNWQEKEFPNTVIRSFHFTDPLRGWAVGGILTQTGRKEDTKESWRGAIYTTEDGGDTWREISTGIRLDHNWTLFDIWPINENKVWVVGDAILRSGNGGKTWKRVNIEDGVYGSPSKIQFNGERLGWITTNQGNRFLLTRDGGESWEVRQGPDDAGGVYNLIFVGEDTVWWVVNNIFHSNDGGKSWAKEMDGRFNYIYHIPGSKLILAVGDVLAVRPIQ